MRGIIVLALSIRLLLKRNSKQFTNALPALNGSSSPNQPVAAMSFPSKLEKLFLKKIISKLALLTESQDHS